MSSIFRHSHFIIFIAIAAFALLINVGSYGVTESSDARYAEIAREMYISKDYIHPNLLEIHHYHKPPLTYQITALGYVLFGVNAFGARFFLQIAILIQLLLIYSLANLLYRNKKIALWAAIIFFSFPIVLMSSRNLTTDAFLHTFILASIYAWVRYRMRTNVLWFYIFTISLAMGFLTKGPVVFITPLAFIIFFNKIEKSKSSFSIHHLLAWLLFLGIASSWFIYLIAENTNFLAYFLGRQTVDRFSVNAFDRTEPFWYFLVFAPLVGLPWIVILIFTALKNKIKIKKSLCLALLMGCVIPLIFFSISSSKRILYILQIYGLLAILSAYILSITPKETIKLINSVLLGFTLIVTTSLIIVPFLHLEFRLPYVLSFFGVLLLLATYLIFKSGNISIRTKSVYLTLITTIILLISSSFIFSENELKINATKPLTDYLKTEGLNQRNILVFNTRKPSIAFGLNKQIISLYVGDKSLEHETQFENEQTWKNYLINLKNTEETVYLEKILQEPSVLLVQNKKNMIKLLKSEKLTEYYKKKKVLENWVIYY